MSGHSKWANIRFKKSKEDAKRGKIFTKLAREIIVSAREGGGDPDSNPRLRSAIAAAKAANMPKENIERAIKRGTGELPGVTYEEITYEGYGPGGAAVMVEVITDNRNRTVSEVRHIFSKYGGNLGETGCVSWVFQQRGLIEIDGEGRDEDTLMQLALESGAEDMEIDQEMVIFYTEPSELESVRGYLEEQGITVKRAEITRIPSNQVEVTGSKAESLLKMLNALEALDEVQNTYSNFDITDSEMPVITHCKKIVI
jgi:YebC/PmpR family DNA-binding regulatory protein